VWLATWLVPQSLYLEMCDVNMQKLDSRRNFAPVERRSLCYTRMDSSSGTVTNSANTPTAAFICRYDTSLVLGKFNDLKFDAILQTRRQEMKWGGGAFCKKSGPYPHKMKRNWIKLLFYFTFYLFFFLGGGCVRTQRTPSLPTGMCYWTEHWTTCMNC